jgi:dolichyl-phosphate beta-glucosyltransferase
MIDQPGGIYLSVIIPAYNEALRLPPTLKRMVEYLSARDFTVEVIVVDDGSSDNTSEVAREALEGKLPYQVLRNEPNRGKALSVKRGLLEGRGKYLLFSDADLSTPIEEAEKLLAELEQGADLAIASRQLPGSVLTVHQPKYRELAGRMFGILNMAVLLPGIPDSQCGFKAFKREVAHDILSHQKSSTAISHPHLPPSARRTCIPPPSSVSTPVTCSTAWSSKAARSPSGSSWGCSCQRVRGPSPSSSTGTPAGDI